MAEHSNKPMNLFIWLGPAWGLLVLGTGIAVFVTNFTFLSGVAPLWKAPLRFLRLALNLTLPLVFLPFCCRLLQGLINRRGRGLIGAPDVYLSLSPVKGWMVRPFQGIGLSLLFASRLLAVLQGYTGTPIRATEVLPTGYFQFGRFLVVTGLGILVSLLLSLAWALDDLGVRYRNDRTGEVRLMGRFLGVILPIGFGFYGFFNILANVPFLEALAAVFQMVVILYPPFCTLAVVHAFYLQRYGDHLLRCLRVDLT
uniref:Uncharacterized protein n=1 Tax=Desulfobacca acetoxidans TaxID=60893 RepID=A0A7C3Z1M8_9BACT